MPNAKISFSLVKNDLLALKDLEVKQADVVVELTGKDQDPTTLQRIRDDAKVKKAWQDSQKEVSDLVASFDKQLQSQKRLATKKRKNKAGIEGVLRTFNRDFKKACDDAQAALQAEVKRYCDNDEKVKAAFKAGLFQWVVSLVFTSAKIAAGTVTTLTTGGLGTFVATAKELYTLANELWTAAKTEAQQRVTLNGVLDKIKKKQGASEGLVKEAEAALAAYPAKVHAVDQKAKALSVTLDKLLSQQETTRFLDVFEETRMEVTVQNLIEKITEMNEIVSKADKLQKDADAAIKKAKPNAQKDWWDYLGLIVKSYDALPLAWDWPQKSAQEIAKVYLDKAKEKIADYAKEKVKEPLGDAWDFYGSSKAITDETDPKKRDAAIAKAIGDVCQKLGERHAKRIKSPTAEFLFEQTKDFKEFVDAAVGGD